MMKIETLLFFLWILASISEQGKSGQTNSLTTVGETIPCHIQSNVEYNTGTTAMIMCISPIEYNVSCYMDMDRKDGTFVCNGSSNNEIIANYGCDCNTSILTDSEINTTTEDDKPSYVNSGNECGTTTSENMASSTSGDLSTSAHAPSNSVTVAVLGALVSLLAALLALVTTGWIWTYLLMRKRERMNISSEKIRSSADDLCLNNPTYSGDDILHLQPPSHAPTYETIQPNPTDGGKLVLTQQGDSEYNVLNRNQNTSTKTASLLETINEDDIEDSYSKLERTATSNGSREFVNDGDYSKLETLAIESTMTGQAAQSITASEEGGVMNDKGRKDENVTEEASTEEGGTQLENEVAQKDGEEEGERQGKEEGGEQQVLLLFTTTTDERKFGNGSDNEENDLSMTTNPSYNMMRMRNK